MSGAGPPRPFLAVDGLSVSYGEAKAVSGVSFKLDAGRAVAVLGANGSGKSSLAAALVGVVRPSGGRVSFDGVDITRWPAHRVSRAGIAYVPEGRGIYPHLTVADNLRAMLRYAVPRRDREHALERAVELFPVLGERRKQAAGTLSGGEQQMLSLARVLAAPPKVLVADEMSLGLAPKMVDVVFESLTRAKAAGVTVVLVEQYVERALALADDAIVLRQGVTAWSGAAADAHSEVAASYLGGEPR
ncbi:MAG: branched-chain amino acid transport system ATP-binding protein livF [Actinomycetota bacterium]|nr:branched-chain amino acid transport system ATP-binding protein livF [Actinomycetota bacterium]